ncbi:MAG: enoyl-CoA hydratase/isomerase family protein [Planctomycetes bacterium]|nr:enoyl-CoA hydratase/isomerase family protein [Planctomycetota bacterium]
MPTTIELVREQPEVARVVFRTETGVHILSTALLKEFQRIVEQVHMDKSVRVVVIESAGRTFLAGADLRELQSLTPKRALSYSRQGQQLFQRIAELTAVTISAIHGPCAGGGVELSLACDLRIAATSAKIGLPEVKLGLIPGWGGSVRATLLLGPSVAQRIILSGELLPAAEALRLGLVDAVYPDGEFREAVNSRIAQYLQAGPAAVAAAKGLIREMYGVELIDLLEMEAERFADCYRTGEPASGTAAFLEKRPAAWACPAPNPPEKAQKRSRKA